MATAARVGDKTTTVPVKPVSSVHTEALGWDPSYSVEVTQLDKHHQYLFCLINILLESQGKGKERFAVAMVLADLADYAENHFKVEEALMEQANYPALAGHGREHEAFVARIAAALASRSAMRFRGGEPQASSPEGIAPDSFDRSDSCCFAGGPNANATPFPYQAGSRQKFPASPSVIFITLNCHSSLTFLGVIGTNMGCELFVALQLEVAHHFLERRAGERSRRFEPPVTFGTTKAPKTLLVNPYQLPAHGGEFYMRQSGWSVGHPTNMEDSCVCARPISGPRLK